MCCSGRSRYLAHLGQRRDRVQQLVVHRVRIAVEHPHPVDALDGRHVREQVSEQQRLSLEVAAVAGGVLRDERHLGHALFRQLAALLHDVVIGPGAIPAADQRDGAVGAAVVAAVADLDVGRVGRGGQHAVALVEAVALADGQRPLALLRLVDDLEDALVVGHAHEAVRLAQRLAELLAVALRQAAGGQQELEPARSACIRPSPACVSIDSSLADWMKPQVLTMMISASCGSSTIW